MDSINRKWPEIVYLTRDDSDLHAGPLRSEVEVWSERPKKYGGTWIGDRLQPPDLGCFELQDIALLFDLSKEDPDWDYLVKCTKCAGVHE